MSPLTVKPQVGDWDQVSEKAGRHKTEKLGVFIIRSIRYWLSAIYWASIPDPVNYFYLFDRKSGRYVYYISPKEIAHSFTIILTSSAGVGIGIGQLCAKLLVG